MPEHKYKAPAGDWMNPATERLLSKITNLEEMLEGFQGQDLDREQKHVVKICQTYLEKARGYTERPLLTAKFPFFGSRHPHLIWELLHRVDEYFIFLYREEELYSRALDVKISFDMNIKEEKMREEWIGETGKLLEILEEMKAGQTPPGSRYVIRDALKLVNEQMDRTFWQLSMNTLTSLLSGLLLGALMLLAWKTRPAGSLELLKTGGLGENFGTLIILGLMGAYLSNLMTREDFLYVRGGPFWRYFLHHLASKPLMSAFAAGFIYLLEKSKLVFSITAANGGGEASDISTQMISINVSPEGVGYVYAVLAIVSAFAADKVLRNTIDCVLKRMAQQAEKTKETAKA